MNDRRDFDRTHQIAPPTVATPTAATQPVQPTAWSEQDPNGGYNPSAYDQAPTDVYYNEQQPPQYYQQPVQYAQPPAAASLPPLPWYRKPGVLFGGAAAAAMLAVAALVATWQMGGVSTTPANTTGTPSQQSQAPVAPAPPPSPAPLPTPSAVAPKPIPAPRQQAPRQQAPAPRFAPNSPANKPAAPVVPSAGPSSPVNPPPPEEKQAPPPEEKQAPPPEEKQGPGDFKDPETGADTRGKADTPPPAEKQAPPPADDGKNAVGPDDPPPVLEDHTNDPCFPDCGGFAGNG
jgi:hypothetical protein